MRTISRVAGFIAAWSASFAAASTAHADDERVVTEVVVEASVDDVWGAWTTKQGMESWMVAHAEIELKVGGKMLTHYNPNGQIGDPNTIENTILSFEPNRMLSIKATKPPENFPFKEALRDMWTVLLFEPLGANRTRVRVVSMGFRDTEESRKMRQHFEAGNAWTMKKLQAKFADAPSKPVPGKPNGAGAESSPAASGADLVPIKLEVTVSAPPADAWKAWATNEGAQAFFAPKTNIELRVGGPYEILFSPDNPPGQRGAEDLRVLSFLPLEMLSFEWSAPPQFARARPQRTWVVLRLGDAGEGRTRVQLTHLGFKERADARPEERDEWVQVHEYFAKAWPRVLANFKRRFDPDAASP